MGLVGPLALIVAAIAAAWLLFGAARGSNRNARTVSLLKAAAWFGIAAALFAAKLFPLALMILVAAGGITAIETWREKITGSSQTEEGKPTVHSGELTRAKAAQILGVSIDASSEEIKAAHKRLIAQMHPDRGGTDYLAAQINEARALLLRALN